MEELPEGSYREAEDNKEEENTLFLSIEKVDIS